MKKFTAFLAILLLLTLLPLSALADSMAVTGGSFLAATYNVDGLPGSILGISINPDAPGESGMKEISAHLAEKSCDFVGFQEDFNYHQSLTESLGSYTFGTWRGRRQMADQRHGRTLRHVEDLTYHRFRRGHGGLPGLLQLRDF